MSNSGKYGDAPFNAAVIHGDYDPHPLAGVREPPSTNPMDFRIIEIGHCGQKPWIER